MESDSSFNQQWFSLFLYFFFFPSLCFTHSIWRYWVGLWGCAFSSFCAMGNVLFGRSRLELLKFPFFFFFSYSCLLFVGFQHAYVSGPEAWVTSMLFRVKYLVKGINHWWKMISVYYYWASIMTTLMDTIKR